MIHELVSLGNKRGVKREGGGLLRGVMLHYHSMLNLSDSDRYIVLKRHVMNYRTDKQALYIVHCTFFFEPFE